MFLSQAGRHPPIPQMGSKVSESDLALDTERAEALLPFSQQTFPTQIDPAGLHILFTVPPPTDSSRISLWR